jgi:Protein of unknown function (DUF3788)
VAAAKKKTKRHPAPSKRAPRPASNRTTKPAGTPATFPATKPLAPARAAPPKSAPRAARSRVPFAKPDQPPTEAELVARLPLATGKKLDAVRTFLKKQKRVAEDLYFYGPKTGWAFRYLRGSHSVATIMIHGDHLMGIVALDAAALEIIDFSSLSEAAQHAHKMAHGSPSLLWLDLPLEGSGASDFKSLLRSKLKSLPAPGRTPPPPPPPPPRRDSPA